MSSSTLIEKIEEGYRYRDPAPQTVEYMEKTSQTINEININMTKVEGKVDNLDKRLESIESKLDKFIDNVDSKYSGKWVEKVIWGIGATIGLAIIGALLSLILKQ